MSTRRGARLFRAVAGLPCGYTNRAQPCRKRGAHKRKRRPEGRRSSHGSGVRRRFEEAAFISLNPALGRPGSDLLSHVLRRSIIGAEKFNGRVRNGIGFRLLAIATRPAKRSLKSWFWVFSVDFVAPQTGSENENDQANRAISTGKLHALLRFHTRPINVVVFHGSQGRTRFEVGFPLRCFQRLSRPHIATLQCGWRHNRSTRDSSNPVLSY